MCASVDGATCSGDANGWATGWIVHRAGRGVGPTTDAGPPLRHHQLGYPPGWTIRSSDGRRHLRFLPDGRDIAAEMIRAGVATEYCRYSGGFYGTC